MASVGRPCQRLSGPCSSRSNIRAVPDEAVPDEAVPEEAVPDEAVPDRAVLEPVVPRGAMPRCERAERHRRADRS